MQRSAMVVLAGLMAASCGGGSNPAAPGRPATPTPVPAPTPTPVASSTPSPGAGLSCTVPSQPEILPCDIWSKAQGNVFRTQVIAAIEAVKREKPQWFDQEGGDRWRILNREKYMFKVVEILQRDHGLCATWAQVGLPRDEVSVKNANDFNEQYDIVASGDNGEPYVWYSYEVTCRPAVF
jgi:hypothetical protein